MKPFRELSRRGRLRRLRGVAKLALAAYGLEGADLSFIQYGENIIYRVDTAGSDALTGTSPYLPNRYVLRIHAMGDIEAIASELTWLEALDQEAGLPVPAPVSTPEGSYIVAIAAPGMPHERIVSLMRWLDGNRLRQGLRPKHLTALGQVVAQLHNFSAGWQPPTGFARPHWDWEAQLGGSLFDHSVEELVASMPIQFQEAFQTVSQEARQAMEFLGKGPEAYGLIHADLYPENVLFKAGKAYPIDFEDCGFGYWMWDIAVALCQWAWGEDWERMRDAFREGYAQVRTLPEAQWAQLDLFVATQFATMVLWASEFLKHDPGRVAEYVPWRDNNGKKLLCYFDQRKPHNITLRGDHP
jgi:Ser/Thr protein kinase RdoA (MazF antagonist)